MVHALEFEQREENDMSKTLKTTASASTIATTELAQPLTLHFHVSILEYSSNEVSTFYLEDAVDLKSILQRKLGITKIEGLVEFVNELGLDEIHTTSDPKDEDRLIVSESEEGLEELARLASR
jgi:hypothetical protein